MPEHLTIEVTTIADAKSKMAAAKRLLAGVKGASIKVEIEGDWIEAGVDYPFYREYSFKRYNAEVMLSGKTIYAKYLKGHFPSDPVMSDYGKWTSVIPDENASEYRTPTLTIRIEIR